MASGIEIRGSDLHLKNVKLPLKTATSFCISGQTTIHLYLTHGAYQTILRLSLKDAANMRQCVTALLTRPSIKPALFWVSQVAPVLRNQKAARVFFKFCDEFNLQCFQDWVKEPGWTIEAKVHTRGIFARLTHQTEEPGEEDRVRRINNLFSAIRDRFCATEIDKALKLLENPRFPHQPASPPKRSPILTRQFDL